MTKFRLEASPFDPDSLGSGPHTTFLSRNCGAAIQYAEERFIPDIAGKAPPGCEIRFQLQKPCGLLLLSWLVNSAGAIVRQQSEYEP